jgi:hypothetical protein
MKNKALFPLIIIVNACIWGFAMIMSARALSGTGAYQEIQHILAGCAAASLILVGGGLAAKAKKPEQDAGGEGK